MPQELKQQDAELVFALDIGTRSIIGVAGRVVDERLEVLAIEKEEHGRRAMLDGQIEDIGQVAKVARRVTERMEQKLGCRLRRVCVAAAGRALRTEKGHYAMDLPQVSRIDSDLISHLESGAVSDAEERLKEGEDSQRRFYLVGYTVSSYLLDRYPLTSLKDHNGQQMEADVVATFLPSEVVESLYTVMEAAGLEVASLTLEPIAALNAVIPAELRLLNLVLADIGAGTSDIAVCRDGAVVGYTMATIAGDEITESLMRQYLINFSTAERMKMQLEEPTITYRDVLGLEQTVPAPQVREALMGSAKSLAQEIAQRVVDINGASPSAMFLAGGGSKLVGLRELVAQCLDMDDRRVALAGNNYEISAFSQEYELNDPEYATPLGIAVSAGLGLISDSYRILLNGQPAKLFRSGTLTVLDLLMMNGYTSADLLGRTGKSLSVTLDGQRLTFRGESAVPCTLKLNGEDTAPSAVVYAGDAIEFIPAVSGQSAERTAQDLLGEDFLGGVLINGRPAPLDQLLHSGDQLQTTEEPFELTEDAPEEAPLPKGEETEPPAEPGAEGAPEPAEPEMPEPAPEPAEPAQESAPAAAVPQEPAPLPAPAAEPARPAVKPLWIYLNGQALVLPGKADGGPYYLMDLLDRSGIDFETLDCPVVLQVNGADCPFTHELRNNDQVTIRREERRTID
ncbi:MAG: pilus assembly protein PilM [Oscillospiraceae bacterium]|jgi:cell division protein FtsA|nr:pilus assembly protein PilM [Oscillospiraceae bacterium]